MPNLGDQKTSFCYTDKDIIVRHYTWQESKNMKTNKKIRKWVAQGVPSYYSIISMETAVARELLKNYGCVKGETLEELLGMIADIRDTLQDIAEQAEQLVEMNVITKLGKGDDDDE